MIARIVVRLILLSIASVGCVALLVGAQVPQRANPAEEKSISVTSFMGKMPIGRLGVPLGTVVRITGVVIEKKKPHAKADEGKTFLRISTVNGKALDHPVEFEFGRAPVEVKKPSLHEKFDYYVHEYGEFDGIVVPPKELGIKDDPIAGLGFHYSSLLTLHASNPVK